jgi:putative endonuclease
LRPHTRTRIFAFVALQEWVAKFRTLFVKVGDSADGADPQLKSKPKDALGQRGENLAAKELQKLGYRLYIRNFKCHLGEIDIIARDGKTLVFVEVKTRLSEEDVTPEEQINSVKQHQITKAAKYYLSRYGDPKPPARFDVVAIVWPQGQAPVIRHVKDAFEPTF